MTQKVRQNARGPPQALRVGFALDREQIIELIGWKFQSMAHRKALAMRGVSLERWGGSDGAAERIRRALADGDDDQALVTVCGIDRFGPAMGSVVLAACRPDRFTVADSNALRALRGLGLMPAGPPGFRHGRLAAIPDGLPRPGQTMRHEPARRRAAS